MTIFDQLERRFGWLAFPGFLRNYAILHAMVFALQIFRPDISALLVFDRERIFAGEVWRVVTMFFAFSEMGTPSIMSIILMFFVISLIFMVSDGLEGAWGSFKATLFYYTGMVAVLAVSFLYQTAPPWAGSVIYGSAFLAFATLFPRVELLLFFVLPVQVRFLGMLAAGGMVMAVVRSPQHAPFLFATLLNYLVWAGIPFFRGQRLVLESGKRRQAFNSAKAPAGEAFHTCAVCGKTDLTDPRLDFRMGNDGEEYCVDHLPS